jgi:3-oxoacyl-[acyl-carrier protein] reductase
VPITTRSKSGIAIVTGGSRGIGRSVVQRLARDGLSIVVGYGSHLAEANSAVAAAEATGVKAIAVAADVAAEDAVARLFDEAEEAFGGIDVVVNAAGLMLLALLMGPP